MKFSVIGPPIRKSPKGKNMKATKTDKGTLNATKNALVTPMKNMRMSNTRIKPMMMVFTSSLNEVSVCLL